MKKEYILFIDSGVGGLSILSEVCKLFPSNFIYFSDNGHCPYGSRSKSDIFELLKNIIVELKRFFEIKVVVLACNTATTSSIKKLRETFPNMSFVGTEPAIKLAFDKGFKRIGVLCTPATAHQQKYLLLSQKFDGDVHTFAMPNLAKNIELFLTTDKLCFRFEIIKDLYQLKSKLEGSDVLVLGCTHYVLISKLIHQITGKKTVDGNFGVAKQVVFACKKNSSQNASKNNNFCKENRNFIESKAFEIFACSQKNLKKLCLTNNKQPKNKNQIVIMLSNPSKTLEEKYIKTFMQILANNQNL